MFLEETSAKDAPQLFPDTLATRGLAEGYSKADLLKDLPNLGEDMVAQPNVSLVDLAQRGENDALDSPEFVQGMADYGIGVTVVYSSQPETETATTETPVHVRLGFQKFVCIRDTPEATRDEIYWVYGASNAAGIRRSASRVNTVRSTRGRCGSSTRTDYWRFSSSEGIFDLYVKASVPDGTRLRHATTTNGSTWSPGALLPTANSKTGAALATYKDRLYCVHRSGEWDEYLYWSRFDGSSWLGSQKLGTHQSTDGPAVAVYKNSLHVVHRGGIL
ncbi:hypothetical protein ACH4SK_18785 [Streptomyces inhibens]|uniref:hypothetical protein n=1 Tax=Streptomyces inhibens TaxID=2293571 RepID=UPI003799AF2C